MISVQRKLCGYLCVCNKTKIFIAKKEYNVQRVDKNTKQYCNNYLVQFFYVFLGGPVYEYWFLCAIEQNNNERINYPLTAVHQGLGVLFSVFLLFWRTSYFDVLMEINCIKIKEKIVCSCCGETQSPIRVLYQYFFSGLCLCVFLI